MTREELFKEACKRCEEYSDDTDCECIKDCPIYNLYLLSDDWKGVQGNCDFEQQPKPEMI